MPLAWPASTCRGNSSKNVGVLRRGSFSDSSFFFLLMSWLASHSSVQALRCCRFRLWKTRCSSSRKTASVSTEEIPHAPRLILHSASLSYTDEEHKFSLLPTPGLLQSREENKESANKKKLS